MALKAVYYLIDKRLKQGLSFPDPDFNYLLENDANIKITFKINENSAANANMSTSNSSINNIANNANTSVANQANLINSNQANFNTNVNHVILNGVTKHNSQLLPKRHGVQVVARSSSQKNVDFKSIFNNMNLNGTSNSNSNTNNSNANRNLYSSTTNRDDTSNNNYSNSPSPDFIAAAMSPIKTNQTAAQATQLNSASSARHNSRQTNYQDLVNQRKFNNNNNNAANQAGNATSNSNSNIVQSRSSAVSNGSQNENRLDRYYVPSQANSTNTQQSEPDGYNNQVVYYQSGENRILVNSNATNTNRHNTAGIRSLPGSIYRGSPERGAPNRSPDRPERSADYNNNSVSNHRPTTSRISSSRPTDVISSMSTDNKSYDTQQKFKVVNYLAAKRSLTSCDESTFEGRQKNQLNAANNNIVKTRQLQMGKAKIDLDTQPSIILIALNLHV